MSFQPTEQQFRITRQSRLDDLPEFLSVAELCSFLDIGRAAGYALVRNGALPSARLGKKILVPRAALLKAAQG